MDFFRFPLILSECYSSHNWRLLFQVKLHFVEDALRLIARKAISKNTGARGLRSILENILMDAMYEVCSMPFFLCGPTGLVRTVQNIHSLVVMRTWK